MSDTTTDAPKREMTPEELAERRQKMLEHYEAQIPILEAQKVYETLLADIEDQRTRRLHATLQQAHMMAPPPPEPEEQPASQETASERRTLKREK